jgi:hypothetical protein
LHLSASAASAVAASFSTLGPRSSTALLVVGVPPRAARELPIHASEPLVVAASFSMVPPRSSTALLFVGARPRAWREWPIHASEPLVVLRLVFSLARCRFGARPRAPRGGDLVLPTASIVAASSSTSRPISSSTEPEDGPRFSMGHGSRLSTDHVARLSTVNGARFSRYVARLSTDHGARLSTDHVARLSTDHGTRFSLDGSRDAPARRWRSTGPMRAGFVAAQQCDGADRPASPSERASTCIIFRR